jgi:GNAT superfamily N-acetyltransferase
MSEVVIRDAKDTDAEAIAILMGQLGYPQDAAFVIRKLAELRERKSSRVVVAEEVGGVAGFLSFDCEPAFHREGWIGTITALCVLESVRGKGIGRKLVERAEKIAREKGCVRLAVASGVRRLETHQFYLGLGYEEKTKRFVKDFE